MQSPSTVVVDAMSLLQSARLMQGFQQQLTIVLVSPGYLTHATWPKLLHHPLSIVTGVGIYEENRNIFRVLGPSRLHVSSPSLQSQLLSHGKSCDGLCEPPWGYDFLRMRVSFLLTVTASCP